MTVHPEIFYYSVSSQPIKHVTAIGYGGDVDPAFGLEQMWLYNSGSADIRVGSSLSGVLGSSFLLVKTGSTVQLDGAREGLVIYNPSAQSAAVYSMQAECWRRNASAMGGMKPRKDSPGSATRYFVVRPTKTAGATTDTTITLPGRYTLAAVKLYSVTVATGATITLDVLDRQGRSLLSTPYDVETLTTATLATATLTSSSGLLTLAPNDTITLRYASSDAGDTLGDILVELSVTEA